MKRLRELQFYPDGFPAVGLLFLRIFAGYTLAQHGLGKIQNPFGWMDAFHPGVPGIFQALAAASEFFGGIALIFGVLTPLACLGIMGTMVVATMSNIGQGQSMIAQGPGPSWELSGLYFVIALTLFLTGPGLLSFDYFVFGRKKAAPVAS
ncbi:putative oxidoreductase [Abditibacterium utsteinense]|uniref:Putative oxidoreductase n=1 Tax=Abditibacterium utsteinense TaxID=1960156 RepID=A0A2S8SR33_9BACT|nr:DoxX family protein [Abditibacterium utsteinense]PQV63209.1 putative oxidoreductase [Abditibacterium utsteinense]